MHLKAWCVRLIQRLGSQVPQEGGGTAAVEPTHQIQFLNSAVCFYVFTLQKPARISPPTHRVLSGPGANKDHVQQRPEAACDKMLVCDEPV